MLRPCRLAQGHWEHAVAERRVHLVLLNFFHRNAALEAAILELAEQPISVFRLGRLFAFKERRPDPRKSEATGYYDLCVLPLAVKTWRK